MLKTIENKRKLLISLGGGGNAGCSTAVGNTANADTSSDGDMDMELSDYKFNDFVISNRGNVSIIEAGSSNVAANETSVSFKTSTNTTNEVGTSTDGVQQRKVSAIIADDMSLTESDITANTSIATTNTPLNMTSRRTLASSSNPAQNIDEEDDDTHSMEMSSISID